jgi:hypothetical protein
MSRVSHPNKAAPPMPGNVRTALVKRELMDAYRERPQYQQHEYLKWIASANGETTKQKRLDQMLDELKHGGLYMGEPWTPPAPVTPATSPTPRR